MLTSYKEVLSPRRNIMAKGTVYRRSKLSVIPLGSPGAPEERFTKKEKNDQSWAHYSKEEA